MPRIFDNMPQSRRASSKRKGMTVLRPMYPVMSSLV